MMKNPKLIMKAKFAFLLLFVAAVFLPKICTAAVMNDYCITPPFITAGVKPNLLLMIDNSASMYDLSYVDKGKKHCSNTTATSCSYDTDCPSGETCSVFERSPFYCYDQTYSSANSYYGYFDKETFYYYRTATDDFAPVASSFPAGCGSVAANITKTIADTMCVEYTSARTLVSFVAKGNYLNWLTTSKFDVQKQILTGGKFDGSGLIPESRGCVGQGYVKQALTGDFVNFVPPADPNVSLEVTFKVRGPENPNNLSAPSTGGQTYIDLFTGATYDYSRCQDAIESIASGSLADITQDVAACLTAATPEYGTCQTDPATPKRQCLDSYGPTVPNCDPPYVTAHCQADSSRACTAAADCIITGGNFCAANITKACTGDADCVIPEVYGCSLDQARGCTADSNCKVAAVVGRCSKLASRSCTWNGTECDSGNKGPCIGASAPHDYGTCSVVSKAVDQGPCKTIDSTDVGPCLPPSGGYVGPCALSPHATLVKTKVAFQQSLQACWALRTSGTPIGGDDILTVINQCETIFAGYKTCSNNSRQSCTADADCGTGTCLSGPNAIGPGNWALLCGQTYEGQYYELKGGVWQLKAGYNKDSQEMKDTHTTFCKDLILPNVIDPTDAPSNTQVTDNIPAILNGVGVEAQLGLPIKTMRAKVVTSTPPSGLVQQFSDQIRMGTMSFNAFGSASEVGLSGIPVPKTCSNNPAQTCVYDVDCGSGNWCAKTTAHTDNLDGARILYPIGYGVCSTMTSTPCTVDTECGFNSCLNGYCGFKGTTPCTTVAQCAGADQACIANGAGAHTTSSSLIKSLDDIRANSWTPFSEAYFTAIGYFARIPSGVNVGKSRADLRLNSLNSTSTDFSGSSSPPVDFNENLNPSEMRCQQNYTLLISDGSATADRNPSVNALANLYAAPAGITQTTCTAAPSGTTVDYGGSNNLPIMSWLAKNRNISTLSTVSPASTAAPAQARDSITSYVVFNGESNGASGDCNSLTLLTKTATNGGTTIKQANDYNALATALTSVFQDVAAKAASGTAASILSNSEGSGANILQAVFYPKKIFESNTPVSWIGEMQNLWYYVDPYINNSTIREDTDGPDAAGVNWLDIATDYVARFAFDNSADKTLVQLLQDTNADGTGDTAIGGLIDPDYVKSIWRAGKQLWSRDLTTSPRTIYTPFISGGTEVTGSGMMTFTYGPIGSTSFADNSTVLQPYLQLTAAADTQKLMKWTHGFDFPGDNSIRSRTVKIGNLPGSTVSTVATDQYVINPRDKGVGVWKLGDIISSTPRVQSTVRLGTYNLPSPGGYNDTTYTAYVNSSGYQDRGMVYVGANDGMLHAFKLGVLSVKASGTVKASLSGPNRGKEEWAFIPKNYLPYLKYMAEPAYRHLYAIDGRTLLLDASIGDASSGSVYWGQPKTVDSWRTIVIGGMGLGGASRRSCAFDAACVQTPINDPANLTNSLGYSSYFALDVTDQNNPKFLWEFSHNQLGYSTTGPSIVRVGDKSKNGRWFAVFGNGPFGPIDTNTHQFKGGSDHHLRFFIVDLKTGELVKTITTDIDNGFAGSMIGGSIDADRRAGPSVTANYQDDAVYAGYTKYVASSGWTGGGVGRIMIAPVTSGEPDATYIANTFNWSKVIDDIGPVTTSIARLQDTRALNKNLWLYFGTGRYFYRDGSSLDDYANRRALFGVKEPCYNTADVPGNVLDHNCTTTLGATCPVIPAPGTLVNQTSSVSTVGAGDPGWCINLDDDTAAFGAERVVTDTVALTTGSVLFTTFKPSMDKCGYGGNSSLRILNYDTGGMPRCNAIQGKVLVQLSTGEFKEISLAEALGCPAILPPGPPIYPPEPGPDPQPPGPEPPTTPPPPIPIGSGKPPSDAPPVISSGQNRPVKKILHIQEH